MKELIIWYLISCGVGFNVLLILVIGKLIIF
jgi:hypothetical protein